MNREQWDKNRAAAGLTVGYPGEKCNTSIYNALREHVEAMRDQLRELNTEIEDLRSECGSYSGSNLDTRCCVQFNTKREAAQRLRIAIEKLEGE